MTPYLVQQYAKGDCRQRLIKHDKITSRQIRTPGFPHKTFQEKLSLDSDDLNAVT